MTIKSLSLFTFTVVISSTCYLEEGVENVTSSVIIYLKENTGNSLITL